MEYCQNRIGSCGAMNGWALATFRNRQHACCVYKVPKRRLDRDRARARVAFWLHLPSCVSERKRGGLLRKSVKWIIHHFESADRVGGDDRSRGERKDDMMQRETRPSLPSHRARRRACVPYRTSAFAVRSRRHGCDNTE